MMTWRRGLCALLLAGALAGAAAAPAAAQTPPVLVTPQGTYLLATTQVLSPPEADLAGYYLASQGVLAALVYLQQPPVTRQTYAAALVGATVAWRPAYGAAYLGVVPAAGLVYGYPYGYLYGYPYGVVWWCGAPFC